MTSALPYVPRSGRKLFKIAVQQSKADPGLRRAQSTAACLDSHGWPIFREARQAALVALAISLDSDFLMRTAFPAVARSRCARSSHFFRFEDRPPNDFRDLRDNGVSEGSQSVQPIG